MPRLTSTFLAIALLAAPLGLDAPARAQVSEIDANMALSAIMSAGSRATQVARVHEVPAIGVVRLNVRTMPRFGDDSIPDVAEFQIFAQRNAAGIRKLQAALVRNPATRQALDHRGISISSVVGVQISSNGSLRLYLL